MTVVKRKRIGGLILKRKDLKAILDEPGTEGIAFALTKVGQSSNVHLNVMRVYAKGRILISEARKIPQTTGALSPLQHPASKATNFNFRHLDKLKKDKFSFGFYSKDSFQKLMQEDYWDEVFISGSIKNYGHGDFMDGQINWFTFNISMRKGIKTKENSKNPQRKASLPTIDLKIISQDGVVHIDALRKKQPTLFNNDKIVETILTNENNDIEGLVLSHGKNDNTVMFADNNAVTSILLTEDQTLRKIFITDSTKKSALKLAEEESVLGGFPLTDFTVGCPPHWHMRGNSKQEKNHDNTVKDAILSALELVENA